MWTSQGLNLGPPDYESGELITDMKYNIINKENTQLYIFGCKIGCKSCKSLIIK